MNNSEKNQGEDGGLEEPFDLSFLEEDLSKLPDSAPEEAAEFSGAKFGAYEIDPSAPLEEQVERIEQAAREQGMPEEVIEKLKEAIVHKLSASDALLNTAKNFSVSAAFATMLAGAEEFTQALGLLGHAYHTKLNKIFGDGSYLQVPICQCELTNDPNINHQHSELTPPNAPADYAKKRKEFVRVTKKFQRDCAALSALVFGIGIGGVQFANDED